MLLLVLEAQALLLALLLWRTQQNRLANRMLAGLLLAIAGLLTPYVIGYAGAYDEWPWLSFAPFAVPLALGPLLYGHVVALAEGRRLPLWHWAAPGAQFLNQALVFPFPLETKNWFDGAVQEPWLSPLFAAAVIVSMAGYAWASWRILGRYAGWLERRRRDPAPAARLRAPVIALGLLVVARAAYGLWDQLVAPVDYFDLFAYYILLGALAVWLGVGGWRGAAAPVPAIEEVAERDWAAQGRAWIAKLRAEEWWRDPELSLERLARLLATNESHLSRGLNEAGGGFAAVLNSARAEAVAARLDAGDAGDLLEMAMDAGFGSKASFNRAFRARFGATPSAYRAMRGASGVSSGLRDPLRRSGG